MMMMLIWWCWLAFMSEFESWHMHYLYMSDSRIIGLLIYQHRVACVFRSSQFSLHLSARSKSQLWNGVHTGGRPSTASKRPWLQQAWCRLALVQGSSALWCWQGCRSAGGMKSAVDWRAYSGAKYRCSVDVQGCRRAGRLCMSGCKRVRLLPVASMIVVQRCMTVFCRDQAWCRCESLCCNRIAWM